MSREKSDIFRKIYYNICDNCDAYSEMLTLSLSFIR